MLRFVRRAGYCRGLCGHPVSAKFPGCSACRLVLRVASVKMMPFNRGAVGFFRTDRRPWAGLTLAKFVRLCGVARFFEEGGPLSVIAMRGGRLVGFSFLACSGGRLTLLKFGVVRLCGVFRRGAGCQPVAWYMGPALLV
jgi:hypothetical protein